MTRRPMDGARKNTGDTAEHAWRGVGPATDYGADMNEPVYAPFAGRVGGWWSGTGGNVVQVVGNGVTFVGQHLNSRTVAIGTYVAEGALIGRIGSTGTATTGPHLHWWIEDHGTRISGETYMYRVGLGYTPYGSRTPNTSAAGGGTTPLPTPEEQEEDMELIYIRPANGTVVDKGVKGVIGDINVKFTSTENRTHFMNLWGTPEKPRNSRVHISYHNVQVEDVQAIFDLHIPSSDKQVRSLVIPSSGGGSADVAPILSAVAGVSAQISNFPTAPTAEENGAATLAAARAAIAKS